MVQPVRRPILTAACATAVSMGLLFGATASAHTGDGIAGGFFSGFLHPVLGWDHVTAMLAVGLWGAFLRSPGIWVLPILFPMVMALGGAAGVLGLPLPFVEIGIALSSVLLGLAVALALRPPLWIAAVLVGLFAIFHGHAHGTELPSSANAAAFALGFVLATGMIHMIGILFGLLNAVKHGALVVRAGGGVIATAGVLFLIQAL